MGWGGDEYAGVGSHSATFAPPRNEPSATAPREPQYPYLTKNLPYTKVVLKNVSHALAPYAAFADMFVKDPQTGVERWAIDHFNGLEYTERGAMTEVHLMSQRDPARLAKLGIILWK